MGVTQYESLTNDFKLSKVSDRDRNLCSDESCWFFQSSPGAAGFGGDDSNRPSVVPDRQQCSVSRFQIADKRTIQNHVINVPGRISFDGAYNAVVRCGSIRFKQYVNVIRKNTISDEIILLDNSAKPESAGKKICKIRITEERKASGSD